MAQAILADVVIRDTDTIVVTVFHTPSASFSRSVDVVANRAARERASMLGWRAFHPRFDYGTTRPTGFLAETQPHTCTTVATYSRLPL